MTKREVVLDTETTGLDPKQGDRIIEIGCIEIVDRRRLGDHFHVYLNPQRLVSAEAQAVHGLSDAFLADKPLFREVADAFLRFVDGAELIIHNAPFDLGFLNHELQLLGGGYLPIEQYCTIVDTLVLARQRHPGQRNSLDALCKRYEVDNSKRDLHGALLDSEILAQVYMAMRGGQSQLFAMADEVGEQMAGEQALTTSSPAAAARSAVQPAQQQPSTAEQVPGVVIQANVEELKAHQAYLQGLAQANGGQRSIWLDLEEA